MSSNLRDPEFYIKFNNLLLDSLEAEGITVLREIAYDFEKLRGVKNRGHISNVLTNLNAHSRALHEFGKDTVPDEFMNACLKWQSEGKKLPARNLLEEPDFIRMFTKKLSKQCDVLIDRFNLDVQKLSEKRGFKPIKSLISTFDFEDQEIKESNARDFTIINLPSKVELLAQYNIDFIYLVDFGFSISGRSNDGNKVYSCFDRQIHEFHYLHIGSYVTVMMGVPDVDMAKIRILELYCTLFGLNKFSEYFHPPAVSVTP